MILIMLWTKKLTEKRKLVSSGIFGNIVDFGNDCVEQYLPDLGSDQTSLHNPWLGVICR